MNEDRNLLSLVRDAAATSKTLQTTTTSLTAATTSLNTTAANYQNIEQNLTGLGDTVRNIKTNINLFTDAFVQMRDGLKDVTTVRLNDINQQFLNNLDNVFKNLDTLFSKYTRLIDEQLRNR